MKLLTVIAGALIFSKIKKSNHEYEEKLAIERAEEERRKNSICTFNNGITYEIFQSLAVSEATKIKRLYVTVDGPIIYGTVTAQSGISNWNFKADFNDYGKITGKYWMSSDNYDSSIPKVYSDKLSEKIKSSLTDFESQKVADKNIKYCKYCGNQVTDSEAVFCVFCGKRL